MLPGSISAPHRWSSRLPDVARRALYHDQMEFDAALSLMWSLLTNPTIASKISKARKMTKNHYYRDDPAFVVLQVLFLVAVTLAFGIATVSRPLTILFNIVYQVTMNYFALGALMATGVWLFVNRVLMGSGHLHEIRRQVDWQHSFDIHCDAYFVYFVCTHVGHFILLPIVSGDSFFCRLVANALFAVGVAAYCLHTFRGYVDLPMLVHQHVLLYPAVGWVVVSVLMTFVTHLNMSHMVLRSVWPSHV